MAGAPTAPAAVTAAGAAEPVWDGNKVRMVSEKLATGVYAFYADDAKTLTGTGGILGILAGIGTGYLIHVLAKFSFAVPVWGMVLGFVSSTGIGLFFGIYPAMKAAQLDPVDSLRWE